MYILIYTQTHTFIHKEEKILNQEVWQSVIIILIHYSSIVNYGQK